MSLITNNTEPYNTRDLGFDKHLVKPDPLVSAQEVNVGLTPEMQNQFESGQVPRNIISGEFIAKIEQAAGVLFASKSSFSDTTAGYRLGIDTDSVFKFLIGDSSSSMSWNGTTLTITGSISASTITGGTIQTSASGQRVVMAGSDDSLRFYDTNGQVVGIGSTLGTAMTIALTADTTRGVVVSSSIASSVGFDFTNSAGVASRGLNISLTGGSGNTSTALNIDHDGNGGEGIFVDVSNAAKGIYVTGAANAVLLDVLATRSGSQTALRVLKSSTSGTGTVVELEGDDGGVVLLVTGASTSTSNPVVKIVGNGSSASAPALFIDKDNSQYAVDIDQDANDGNNTIGIHMNIANAGAGTEYGFEFAGSEVDMTKSSVSGLTGVLKVLAGGGAVYIPLYDTAT